MEDLFDMNDKPVQVSARAPDRGFHPVTGERSGIRFQNDFTAEITVCRRNRMSKDAATGGNKDAGRGAQ
ncbi:hypothetical protein AA21952_2048 [Acetobacter oeni LMG 21952]|nr:hypothetical protein AA21952_2048 [Acetobacter oeni LMG 21952]